MKEGLANQHGASFKVTNVSPANGLRVASAHAPTHLRFPPPLAPRPFLLLSRAFSAADNELVLERHPLVWSVKLDAYSILKEKGVSILLRATISLKF